MKIIKEVSNHRASNISVILGGGGKERREEVVDCVTFSSDYIKENYHKKSILMGRSF